MDFGITNFMSKVDGLGGAARRNRFTVEITPPTGLGLNADSINFLAKTVSFPARTMGTTTYRSGGKFGLTIPYETTYEPVALTMLNTNNHAPRKFWTSWLEYIQSMNSYNMQYYKKFIGSVKILYYDEAKEPDYDQADYEVTLHEAWPKSISTIELGWDNAELADFEIDIQYSWWTETGGGGNLRHGQSYGGRGRTTTTQDTRPRFNPNLER